jgi:PAS domain S-box-containing protein
MKLVRIISSKIGYKLISGFIFISLFAGYVSYVSIHNIGVIGKNYEFISDKSLPLVQHLEEMKFNCMRLVSSASELGYIITENKNISGGSPVIHENEMALQSCKSCHVAFKKYERLIKESFPEAANHLEQIRNSGNLLHKSAIQFMEAKKNGTTGTEALEKKEEMETGEMSFLQSINSAVDHINLQFKQEDGQMESFISFSFWKILVISSLTLILSILISILLSRSLSKPIIKLTQLTDNFRKGNQDTTIEIKSSDEIGVLGKSFNEMAERILQLISQLEDEIEHTKKAEKLVASTALRYQTMLRTACDGIHIFDAQGDVIEANDSFCNMLGYSHDELVHLNVADWDTQWTAEELRAKISELMSHPSIFETRHLCKDGTFRDVEINATGIVLEGNSYLYSSARDITKRKQTEEELILIKVKLELALQSAGMGVWQYNLAEDKRSFDNQVCILMGIDPAKFSGTAKEFFDVIHPDDHETVKAALKKTIEQNIPYKSEYRVIWSDKSIHFISARGKLSSDNEGHPQTINGIIWDITERMRIEEALVREHYLMQMLMDNLPDAIYFKDLESRFVRVSKSLASLFGFNNPDQAIGKSDFDFFLEEHSQQTYDDEQTIIRTGKPLNIEEKETFHDRPDRWVSSIKMPLCDKEGKIIGTFGISRDITKQKASREEIELKSEELQKLNTEKDKFFSIIAHDLRSPLSSFIGFTQLMVEELPSMELADLQEMAVSMKKSASNLYRLLENLLEWARMQRGLISFNPGAVHLHSLVSESIEMMAESIKNKGIEIELYISAETRVIADANMLQTIFRNLISNAVKFTPAGGKVSLLAKTSGNKNIEISVRDSGIGMNQDLIDQLFQLNVETSRRGTGGEPSSGLGLLLCREFIEKLGGRLWVESEEGKGSEFRFTLPCPAEPEENTEIPAMVPVDKQESQVNPEISGLKILLAEDDAASEMLISWAVRIFDKDILKVRTGVKAVEACLNNPDIDLILMDIRMPEMDGYEATRQIRKFNPTAVIIAQTAFALEGDREKAIEAGCNDYILKPIKKDELLTLIRRYIHI